MTISNVSIVDRVVERIKTQPLGDLITEEDLYDIVKEAIPKAFFEKKTVTLNKGSYNQTQHTEEPVIVTALRDALQEHVRTQIKDWMAENLETVNEYWKSVMDAGLVEYVQKIQKESTTRHLETVLYGLIQKLNQERMNAGLPMINL